MRSSTWARARHCTEPSLRVLLLNVEGSDAPGIHEPVGIECVAASVLAQRAAGDVMVGDTQFELFDTGTLDLDRLAAEVVSYTVASNAPIVLGLGVPIYGWDHAQGLIERAEASINAMGHGALRHWVLGNAIATFTDPALLAARLPAHTTLVRGDGETGIGDVLRAISNGARPRTVVEAPLLPAGDYRVPPRLFTTAVMERGGAPKLEMSRGCAWGHCTFCSRCHRHDYRMFSPELIAEQLLELVHLGATYVELADEEAFDGLLETAALIHHLRSLSLPVTFMASTRAQTVLALGRAKLLGPLIEVGLRKVFMGAEGGSNGYLRQLAKGQKVADIEAATSTLTAWGVDVELGFITFSWRMRHHMLKENVEFLRRHHRRISWLFNTLEVRGGTADERALHNFVRFGKLGGYCPAEHFDVNSCTYLGTPYLDPAVAGAYKWAAEFADDLRPHYALKSAVRARSLPHRARRHVEAGFAALQAIHFRALDAIVNGDPVVDLAPIARERRGLYGRLAAALGSAEISPLGTMTETAVIEYLDAT